MSKQRLETWSWVLIYGGLLALCLGWFIVPQRGPWGELLFTGGALVAALGVVLIVLRSRMK